MNLNKFTEKAQEALQGAQKLADESRHTQFDVEHLLLALIDQEDGVVPQILRKLDANIEATRNQIETELNRQAQTSGTVQVYMSQRLGRVLDQAEKEAGTLKDEYVSTEHLLFAIADEDKGIASQILKQNGVTRDSILNTLTGIRGNQRVTDPNPEGKYNALEKYGQDLTEMSRRGKLDPVIGRDEEIRRVIQVLSRRTKNNPVLICEPGVGKTAIVEGLAAHRSGEAQTLFGDSF